MGLYSEMWSCTPSDLGVLASLVHSCSVLNWIRPLFALLNTNGTTDCVLVWHYVLSQQTSHLLFYLTIVNIVQFSATVS
jgi:hypothetical protein